MSAPQFTPGPWFYGDEDESVVGVHYVDIHAGEYGDKSYRCIASAEGPFDNDFLELDEESRANAHLIAAAPDLFEALAEMVRDAERNQRPGGGDTVPAKAYLALAKARGEQ